MFLQTSKLLFNELEKVLTEAQFTPTMFKIRFIFTANDWSYEPIGIQGLNIERQCTRSYFDLVTLAFEAHPLDLLDLLRNSQDLYVTVIGVPHSYRTFLPFTEQQFVNKYRVIIENPEDVAKQLNLDKYADITPEEVTQMRKVEMRLPMTLQGIEEKIYDIKPVRINAMFDLGTTMDKALAYTHASCTFDKVDMVPPDNTHPMNNMHIPPSHGADSVYTYLQTAYGVYSKGLAVYYADATLYIYPVFETEPQMENTIHVILGPEKSLEGMEAYHVAESDTVLRVASMFAPKIVHRKEHAPENEGTDRIVTNADKMIDHSGTMDEKGKYNLAEERISGTALGKDNIKVTDAQNVRHAGITSNIYNESTILASNNLDEFSVVWQGADPGIRLRPGQKVFVHYDNDKGEYTYQPGAFTGIVYTMSQIGIKPHGKAEPLWYFTAEIGAFLTPLPDDEEVL